MKKGPRSSLVKQAKGVACFLYRLKKISECGGGIRTLEKEVYMTKRTIMRYINLCYLSPRIVEDMLEYKN